MRFFFFVERMLVLFLGMLLRPIVALVRLYYLKFGHWKCAQPDCHYKVPHEHPGQSAQNK